MASSSSSAAMMTCAYSSPDHAPPRSFEARRYDVFISFRGEDTRHNFTDHLYAALDSKGITTFLDDKRLEKGSSIGPELVDAIRNSAASVVVFSKRYADSGWCLDELVEIRACKEALGQMVVPVFYGVARDEVLKQTGKFGAAFGRLVMKEIISVEKVEKWRDALTKIAGLDEVRWNETAAGDRNESEFVEGIADYLCKLLHKTMVSGIAEGLVGIDSRVDELISCLRLEQNGVRIIGVCGMGGIGKTTTVRALADLISGQFEGCSFLEDVRGAAEERGIEYLQRQLLWEINKDGTELWDEHRGVSVLRSRFRHKRVLIIIDNADNLHELKMLAGKREWFGPGSRILITSRDKHLLISYGVDEIYSSKRLDNNEAIKLLSLKAFKKEHPQPDFEDLSKYIVLYTNGLPLALEVLGSFLHKKDTNEWKKAIKSLQGPPSAPSGQDKRSSLTFEESPEQMIFKVLKLSYDDLDITEQQMFLDIACYFKFEPINEVKEIFESCDFYPEIGLNVLVEKCLITIENNRFGIHDLLQQMGRTLVYQECPEEPGKRSRLWSYEDTRHVLSNSTGTEATEVLILSPDDKQRISLGNGAFSKTINLRVLKIRNLHCPNELDFPAHRLRILIWHGYPLKALPQSFKPHKLLILNLCYSKIQELSRECMHLENLKIIDLSHSMYLKNIPDFTGVPNLEKLILEGCANLRAIHPSIGQLKKLTELNLADCKKLCSIAGVKSLKVFSVSGCSKLNRLPENVGDIEYLEELDIRGTAIRSTPNSLTQLKNLKKLWLGACIGEQPSFWSSIIRCVLPRMEVLLPSSFAGLQALTLLDLSDCNLSEGTLPSDIFSLPALKNLNLSRNNFVTLPGSIIGLNNLETLTLAGCQNLKVLPDLPPSIQSVEADRCSSLTTVSSPVELGLSGSRSFIFTNCLKLNDDNICENVALKLLKGHLQSLRKTTTQHFASHCLDIIGNIAVNVPSIQILMYQLMDILQGLPEVPKTAPSLILQLSGCKIPDWFVYQVVESSVEITLPPHWYCDRTFLGITFCAEFEVKEISVVDPSSKCCHSFGVSLQHRQDRSLYVINAIHRSFKVDALSATNHLWLLYIPFGEYFQKQSWPSVIASFQMNGPYFKFKKTGVRLVFLDDVVKCDPTVTPEEYNSHSACTMVYRQFLVPVSVQGISWGDIVQFLGRNQQSSEAGPSTSVSSGQALESSEEPGLSTRASPPSSLHDPESHHVVGIGSSDFDAELCYSTALSYEPLHKVKFK